MSNQWPFLTADYLHKEASMATTRHRETAIRNCFCFYITTTEGEDIKWTDLTELQAARMNKATELHPPSNILRFGWGRQPGYAGAKYLKEQT